MSVWWTLLPCRHGPRCHECAERKRLAAAEAERKAERQRVLQAEYAKRAGLAVNCDECGSWHPPHAH